VFLIRVFAKPVVRHGRTATLPLKSNGTHTFQPTVLIISLDGFRPDYIDVGVTPNLHLLREMGVAPEYMKPSFPSVTFPNVPPCFDNANDSTTPSSLDYTPRVTELLQSIVLSQSLLY
jgi:hypothetical protein